jgi:hypothetical protein
MARIGKVTYGERQELVVPDSADVSHARSASTDFGGSNVPTEDAGYYHVQTIEAYGRDESAARRSIEQKLDVFFQIMGRVSGFGTLDIKEMSGPIPINNSYKVTLVIVYVVEQSSTSSYNKPESPYAGYQRGASAAHSG